jgi:hypothetical protein
MLNKKKIINYKFKKFNSIGKEELDAASKVIKSGKLLLEQVQNLKEENM